jgi:ABC-type glutathione transport system ATPase component
MSEARVTIRDLVLDARTPRGTAHILRGIDLEIGRGRILGIVGESGSGKSTLASCLVRLLPANAMRPRGRVELDGVDLLGLDEPAMQQYRGRRIAMIFQDPMTALNPLFTIATHLVDVARRREPGLTRRVAKERAA